MAFTLRTGGTRYNLQNGQCVPKRPAAAYTDAAKGHLVKIDTSGNDFVAHCADDDPPYGLVFSVNSSNGLLSIFELRDCEIEFEYNAADAPALGDKVVRSSATPVIAIGGVLGDPVEANNATGVGTVVTKDDVAGLVTVRFG